jgi:hypothetical protein
MRLYVVKFVKKDGKVVYYTNKRQWSQDTLLGTEDFNHATFYKTKGTAVNVMKDKIHTFKLMIDDDTRNYRYKDEVKSVVSVSVVSVNIVEGETESEEFLTDTDK